MRKSFFELLRKRTSVQTTRDFDERFWARFDAEFGEKSSFWDRAVHSLWLRGGLAMGATAAIAFVLMRQPEVKAPEVEPGLIAALGELEGMGEDLDLLQTLDDVDLSSEELQILSPELPHTKESA